MGLYRAVMGYYGTVWDCMGLYSKGCMGPYGAVWGCMRLYWGCMGMPFWLLASRSASEDQAPGLSRAEIDGHLKREWYWSSNFAGRIHGFWGERSGKGRRERLRRKRRARRRRIRGRGRRLEGGAPMGRRGGEFCKELGSASAREEEAPDFRVYKLRVGSPPLSLSPQLGSCP